MSVGEQSTLGRRPDSGLLHISESHTTFSQLTYVSNVKTGIKTLSMTREGLTTAWTLDTCLAIGHLAAFYKSSELESKHKYQR